MRIFKCPCCGYVDAEPDQIHALAEEGVDAAAGAIQDALGVKTGDLAGHVFSDNRVHDLLVAYVLTEIQHANEQAKETIDAGHQARIK